MTKTRHRGPVSVAMGSLMVRRHPLRASLAVCFAAFALAAPTATPAQDRLFPQKPSARVIVDNDFAGDPDGLAALAHQLLTPKTRTVSSPCPRDPKFKVRTAGSPSNRARTAAGHPRLAARCPRDCRGAEIQPGASEAEQAIVARRYATTRCAVLHLRRPLVSPPPLRLEPATPGMTVVGSVAGHARGGWEYNLATDADAARYVIEQRSSPVAGTQIPTGRCSTRSRR
jgi:hypothetical protein